MPPSDEAPVGASGRLGSGAFDPAAVTPVILGGDIGAYATARAFHEAFGVRSTVLTGVATWPVRHSRIVDLVVVPGLGEDAAVAVRALRRVVARLRVADPRAQVIVLASADWLVEVLVEHRAELGESVIVPYPSATVLAEVADKGAVAHRCAELGVPHPRTIVARPGAPLVDVPESFPVIVKAASTSQMHEVSYAGKAKVHLEHDLEGVERLLATMAAAGFDGEVLIQEHIPGGDDAMAAVNVFVDPDGEVRLAQLGRVLLEEHTPTALGNSVAQVTIDPDSVEHGSAAVSGVLRLLARTGFTGFANVDLKRGPDGIFRVLEVNPRVGRSGYAVTASGHNVARLYAAAHLGAPAPEPVVPARDEHLMVVVPLALLRRYVPAKEGATVETLRRRRAVTNPLLYRAETDPRRWWFIAIAMVNQMRKFRRFHPGPQAR